MLYIGTLYLCQGLHKHEGTVDVFLGQVNLCDEYSY